LWPAQLFAGKLPADEHTTLVAQYSPFNEPVEDSAILDLSRPMTHTTDPDSKMESGVAPSMPPASSMLPLPAMAQDAHMPLAQTSATSSLMLLTFIRLRFHRGMGGVGKMHTVPLPMNTIPARGRGMNLPYVTGVSSNYHGFHITHGFHSRKCKKTSKNIMQTLY